MKIVLTLIIIMLSGCVTTYDFITVEVENVTIMIETEIDK